MKYTETAYTGIPEFLAMDDFDAVPAYITESTAVKAGSPIDASGKVVEPDVSTGAITDAVGILLYDVDPAKNPNCALFIRAVVDLSKMNTHSGLTLTAAAIQAVLPGIYCRSNIGVNS